MTYRVVNLRDFTGGLPADVVRIDRRTRWGNPYGMSGENTRELVLQSYRRYLNEKLDIEPDFLEPLRGKWLACWCSPKACHGDVLAEYLEQDR